MGAERPSQGIGASAPDCGPAAAAASDLWPESLARDLTLTAAVYSAATHSGSRAAIESASEVVTYAQLWERAGGLASELHRVGVAAGDVVAICTESPIDHITAMLAALRIRAAYISVDQRVPDLRRRFLFDDVRASAVVWPHLEVTPNRSAGADTEAAGGRDHRTREIPLRSAGDEPDDAVCVFYTSGTTGQPKGVPQTHRGITRLFDQGAPLRFPEPTRMAHGTHLMFDGAVLEIWPTLAQGGTLVCIETSELLTFSDIPALIADRGIEAMFLPTGILREMVTANPSALAGLGSLFTGGERLDVRTAATILERSPDTRFYNLYGPAEGTVVTTAADLGNATLANGVVPIGKPIPRTTVRVLDDDLEPVSNGIAGELFVGGDGVSPGYLNRPDLTERAFLRIQGPDTAEPTTWYRTGDLVRVLDDGQLVFCGRRDRQVKVAGFRVELEEIEAVIAGHPAIEMAVVELVTTTAESGPGRLVAFVNTAPDGPDEGELRRWLGERLPYFQIPREIHYLARIPLTDSGKVDRGLLKRPRALACDGTRDATGTLDGRVAAIWQIVLGFPVDRLDRNFFEAGGTSIDLVALQDAYQTHTGARPSLADLMRYTTVAQQAAAFFSPPLETRP